MKICVYPERENESSHVRTLRTRSWFVMQDSDDAGNRGRAPNKPPPLRGIRLRKTRRCVWQATVNSRRGSLSARNALTSKSIINPSIGLDVEYHRSVSRRYIFMEMYTRSLLTTTRPSSNISLYNIYTGMLPNI